MGVLGSGGSTKFPSSARRGTHGRSKLIDRVLLPTIIDALPAVEILSIPWPAEILRHLEEGLEFNDGKREAKTRFPVRPLVARAALCPFNARHRSGAAGSGPGNGGPLSGSGFDVSSWAQVSSAPTRGARC